MEAWATAFVTGVDQALNQRSILQNEFLDAIITKDASSLQKPPATIEIPPSITDTAIDDVSVKAVTLMQSLVPLILYEKTCCS